MPDLYRLFVTSVTQFLWEEYNAEILRYFKILTMHLWYNMFIDLYRKCQCDTWKHVEWVMKLHEKSIVN